MHLDCKACGAQIQAEDMNLEHLVARCRRCHAVFGFREQLEAGQGQHSDPGSPTASPGYVQGPRARPGYVPAVGRRRPEVPLPKGLSVEREESAFGAGIGFGESAGRGKLRITRRWFSAKYIFLLFFCVAWDGFLVFWYSVVFTEGGEGSVMMGLFPLLHVAVGVGLTYSTLAGFINTTTLTVEDDVLRVRHQPLPWMGTRDLRVADLKQLYVKEHVSRSRNSATTITYRVHAVLDDGRDLKLLSGLEDASQALYVEQQIERHLGIVDEAVGGEI